MRLDFYVTFLSHVSCILWFRCPFKTGVFPPTEGDYTDADLWEINGIVYWARAFGNRAISTMMITKFMCFQHSTMKNYQSDNNLYYKFLQHSKNQLVGVYLQFSYQFTSDNLYWS